MNIKPFEIESSYRMGILKDITVEQINSALGFTPNMVDDPGKVVNCWGFKAQGKECSIWDYKGSHEFGQFSFYGPSHVFAELFPGHVGA